jgi:hypothetical protein
MTKLLSLAAQATLDAFTAGWLDEPLDQDRCQLASSIRALANQPQEVPVHIQGESYWPYVNGIEAMQVFLERIADELEGPNG